MIEKYNELKFLKSYYSTRCIAIHSPEKHFPILWTDSSNQSRHFMKQCWKFSFMNIFMKWEDEKCIVGVIQRKGELLKPWWCVPSTSVTGPGTVYLVAPPQSRKDCERWTLNWSRASRRLWQLNYRCKEDFRDCPGRVRTRGQACFKPGESFVRDGWRSCF